MVLLPMGFVSMAPLMMYWTRVAMLSVPVHRRLMCTWLGRSGLCPGRSISAELSFPTWTSCLADQPRETPIVGQWIDRYDRASPHTVENKVFAEVLSYHGMLHDLGHLVVGDFV